MALPVLHAVRRVEMLDAGDTLNAALAETQAVMGVDYWPYGLAANRAMLDDTLRHLHEDGLLARPIATAALFAEGMA